MVEIFTTKYFSLNHLYILGFSFCILACLVSGHLAYRGSSCAKCDYESEACCSWPGQADAFCSPKTDGCPYGSKTEHPGFSGQEKIRNVGDCKACDFDGSEVCCRKNGNTQCADISGGRLCPEGAKLIYAPSREGKKTEFN